MVTATRHPPGIPPYICFRRRHAAPSFHVHVRYCTVLYCTYCRMRPRFFPTTVLQYRYSCVLIEFFCSGKTFTKELRETSRVRLCRVRQPKVPFVYHACQTEGDGRKQTTDESSRTRPVEWRRLLEYLTNRIDDDDGEKWATVSIYRISSFKFFWVTNTSSLSRCSAILYFSPEYC
jgi:hypothetical protein